MHHLPAVTIYNKREVGGVEGGCRRGLGGGVQFG